MDCLVALADHVPFLMFVSKACEEHNFPFSVVGLNVVMTIFEFLGWGFKSPGVSCGSVQTYRTFIQVCRRKVLTYEIL